MKVLFVSRGNKATGISTIIKNMGNSIANEGIEIEYFKIRGKGILAYLIGTIKMRNELNNTSYNIIHAHYGLCGIVSLLARRNERLVVSFMGSDLMGSDLVKGFRHFFFRYLESLYRYLAYKYFNYTIVKSNRLLRRLNISHNVMVCPNGVNLESFYPVQRNLAFSETGFSQATANIIFVSDPARPEKNVILAMDAVSLITGQQIVLHSICNIDQQMLKYYYSSADALILTSYYEGSPNVIKEAMACNCPVVSTDVGDVAEITDGCDGCYITSYDKNDVAAKILATVKFRKENYHTEGRERISTLGLDEKSIAKKIIDIYRMIL